MPSGDARGADLARGCDEIVKLDVIVAERARNGSTAGEIIGDERADDGLLEGLLEIDDVERDAEVAGDAAGVMHVVDGAAAMPRSPVARRVSGQLRQAALIPKLHGEADDGLAALAQHGRDGGAVDAAAHGHGDGVRCGNGGRIIVRRVVVHRNRGGRRCCGCRQEFDLRERRH